MIGSALIGWVLFDISGSYHSLSREWWWRVSWEVVLKAPAQLARVVAPASYPL